MPQGPDLNGLLIAGLKGTGLRQTLIANNVANLYTPGYHRLDTRFESVLASAVEDRKPVDLEVEDSWIISPHSTPTNEMDNDVDMDMEVGELAKNTSLYKTYLRLLGRTYRQADLAMRDSVA
jgi:flagellar basal-body rod protein FlgB